MMYSLRDYQKRASNAAVDAFKKGRRNGLVILPTGAGKSLVIADIASRIEGPLLVFQPSIEILRQNFDKLQSYGVWDCGVYSASAGSKEIRKITYATIGSVINHLEDFRLFKNVIVDECHGVNSQGGMYERFIHDREDRIVVGLTATPYRLYSNSMGSMLKFITRTRPRIFSDVLYYCQISDLVNAGYLARLEYYDVQKYTSFDLNNVRINSTGADYDERSLALEIERSGFAADLENWTLRTLHPKDGSERKGVLVFTRFVRESEYLVAHLNAKGVPAAIVTGETPKRERERIVSDFRKGLLKVVSNANCLSTGFDYPELDTVIMARPTRSLALYYQIVGRAIRPHEGKRGWFVDMCGSYRRFGKVEDLKIECPYKTQRWMVTSNGVQLTNVIL